MGVCKRLIEGDFVTIKLPVHDVRVTDGMKAYDGIKTVVSKAKKIEYRDMSSKRQVGYIYELSGIKSMKGIPYTFMRDMLYASGKEN